MAFQALAFSGVPHMIQSISPPTHPLSHRHHYYYLNLNLEELPYLHTGP